eukprot:2486683-Rhodomonas_salina.1
MKAMLEKNKAKRKADCAANLQQHKKNKSSDKSKVPDKTPEEQLPGEDAYTWLAGIDNDPSLDTENIGLCAELRDMHASGYYVHTFVIQNAGEAAFVIVNDSYDDGPLQLLAASSSSSEAGSEPGTPRPGTQSGPVDTSDLDSIIAQEISRVVAEESHVLQDSPDLHEVIDVLASGTAIAFIAHVISTWIVFMTQINVSDIISTLTSCLSYAFTASTGVMNDTIFHICQSNIAAFMHIMMTAGWVTMISAATIFCVDLSGKDTKHFLFYYWTATKHFMILWSLVQLQRARTTNCPQLIKTTSAMPTPDKQPSCPTS